MAIQVDRNQVSLKDLMISTDMAALELKRLQDSLAFLKDVSFPEKLEGKIQLSVKELTVGQQGLTGISAAGDLKNGLVKLEELALP